LRTFHWKAPRVGLDFMGADWKELMGALRRTDAYRMPVALSSLGAPNVAVT